MDLNTNTANGSDLSGRRLIGALFADHDHAHRAINDLRAAGYDDDSIGIAVRGQLTAFDGAEGVGETTAKGATSGAVTGGLIGAIVGAALLAVPGVGPVVAGGLFAAAATGAGIGAVGGGLLGALTNSGLSHAEAQRLHDGVQDGKALVTVNALHRTEEAREILLRNGGDLGPLAMEDALPLRDSANRAELL